MCFSRDDFDQNAKAVVAALRSADREACERSSRANNDNARSFALCHWELRSENDGCHSRLYLTHPTITLSNRASTLANQKDTIFLASGGDDFVDEGIIVDDECCLEETATNNKQQALQVATQWKFSIIYSSTYQAPVLYFSVQDVNGNPVGRRLLLEVLEAAHQRSIYTASNDFPSDMWDFLSQEEHPLTGLSSFFLHPCQSAQRLQCLTDVTNKSPTVTNSVATAVATNGFTRMSVLWSWMSMILPAVGHSVPPVYFQQIQNRIAHQSTSTMP